jgi:hypothetical protein
VRHDLARATAAVACLLAAGCAPSPTTPAPDSSWSEPGWMAEQAQRREQFVVRLQACMDGHGWQLTVDGSAGFAEPFASQDEAERAGADRDRCLVEQGVDASFVSQPLTAESLRSMYRYDVDTHACLLAQGVELERRPPSVDRYVEEGLAAQSGEPVDGSWWPYGDPALLTLGRQDVAELQEACPERWTFGAVS